MKSLLVIALFLLSLVAMVAVVRYRQTRFAAVPVRIDSPRNRAARSARGLKDAISRPGYDLGTLERELRFRRTFRND